MTERLTLTDRKLKSLKPAKPGARYEVADTEVTGLRVRVSDQVTSGGQPAISWVLLRRYPGSPNPTRRTLGTYPSLPLTEARTKAREWHRLCETGQDPTELKRQQERAETRAKENTISARAEEYLSEPHVKSQRQFHELARVVRKELVSVWGDRRVDEITRKDIKDLTKAIAARQVTNSDGVTRHITTSARNTLSVAKRFFGWAEEQQYIDGLPTAGIRTVRLLGEANVRQRVLDDDEIRAFWQATEQLGYPYGPMYRMLLLTGCRLREVADARWNEFDLDKQIWTVPPERFKSETQHVVPLSGAVVDLINGLPEAGEYLFTLTGSRPIGGLGYQKPRLDRLMAKILGRKPDPWVNHDLRRAVRTGLAMLRVPDTIAEMVVGHGKKGMQRVYDQYNYLREIRDALELWAGRVRDLTTPPPANVTKLRRGKAA